MPFPVVISMVEQRPKGETPHHISAPLNVVHTVAVHEDPRTGRLMGMSEAWSTPEVKQLFSGATKHGASDVRSLVAEGKPQPLLWDALPHEIKTSGEALKNLNFLCPALPPHANREHKSLSHGPSLNKHQKQANITKKENILNPQTSYLPHHPVDDPYRIPHPARVPSKPRRKPVPELTADEWVEIHTPQAIPVYMPCHSFPVPAPLFQSHPARPQGYVPYGIPAHWGPIHPPVPVFFGSHDDLRTLG